LAQFLLSKRSTTINLLHAAISSIHPTLGKNRYSFTHSRMASFINLDQQIGVPAEALQTLDSADLEQQGAVAAAEMLPSSDDSQAATKNHAKILQNLSHHNFGMIAVILLTLMLCTVTGQLTSFTIPIFLSSFPPYSFNHSHFYQFGI
jgi:hypothetical protein